MSPRDKQASAAMMGHDFIEDKDTFKAVQFARKLIKDGMAVGLATWKAARYYEAPLDDVRKFVAQVGARKRNGWKS